ncbi:MAG: SusD/RagB family nutrient-binding outer membrane lipoprotein [Bacteroidota bacterium]
MKTNRLLNYILAGLLMTFLYAGCTDDFEEINTDTRVLSELSSATIGNTFARSQYYTLMTARQLFQGLFGDYYSGFTANTYPSYPSDRYVCKDNWIDGAWRSIYGAPAGGLDVVLEMTNPAVVEGFETEYAVAQIWKVMLYHRITDYWGAVPYSEFGSGKKSVFYDSQESIYLSFFDLLDSADVVLAANSRGNTFGVNDQIFQGDNDKWRVFGNTLRLRMAMRISDVMPALAKTEAEKAVSNGVMTDNVDNAIMKCTALSINQQARILPWNVLRMSSGMESLMKGYNDPRMDDYWNPTANSIDSVAAGVAGAVLEYKGLRNGYLQVDLAQESLSVRDLSNQNDRWLNREEPVDVILAAEAYFLRAQGVLKGWNMGGGTAQELYESGIEASLLHWDTEADDIAAYIANANLPVTTIDPIYNDAPGPVTDIPVAWDAGDPDVQLEQIITQKWLALFPDGCEGWAVLRRSNLPKMYPRAVSENPTVARDEIISRNLYVTSERSTNEEGVASGEALLSGPDAGGTKLWWDVD